MGKKMGRKEEGKGGKGWWENPELGELVRNG